MTSPIIHTIGAFFALIVFTRFFYKNMPLDHLALLSFPTLLPDVFDKALTGGRYPFHSLLVSGILLLSINLIIRQIWIIKPNLAQDHKILPTYFLLASIAFLIHPIMDLEGLTPLLFPLDTNGYYLEINITIQQAIPPKITNFVFQLLSEPYDYSLTYDHEGDLINTLDVLFLIILVSLIILKGSIILIEQISLLRREDIE